MSITSEITKNARRTNTGEIILSLQRMIRQHEILPGEPLPPIRDLAKRLGVSPLSLGTRLRALTAAGILRSRSGSGTFVVEAENYPSEESSPLRLLAILHGFTTDEIFDARTCLETYLAGLAAERATAEQLTLMMDEVIGMFSSIDDPEQFFKHHDRFHKTVATASDSRTLTALFNMVMQVRIENESKSTLIDLHGLAETHRAIYMVIRQGKSEAAGNAMRKHLFEFKNLLLSEREDEGAVCAHIKTNGVHQKNGK